MSWIEATQPNATLFPSLQRLIFEKSNFVTIEDQKLQETLSPRSMPNLLHLAVSRFRSRYRSDAHLPLFSSLLPQLTMLAPDGVEFEWGGPNLSSCTRLQHLSLRGVYGLTDVFALAAGLHLLTLHVDTSSMTGRYPPTIDRFSALARGEEENFKVGKVCAYGCRDWMEGEKKGFDLDVFEWSDDIYPPFDEWYGNYT
jgi:hypothetical protein